MTEETKKVLTEAQRLAFLKGREKRMANIEKKRLEKAELEEQQQQPPSSPKSETPPPPKVVTPVASTTPFDDLFAKMVAKEVLHSIRSEIPPPPVPAKKPRKARTVKPKPVVETPSPAPVPTDPTPPAHNFSWM